LHLAPVVLWNNKPETKQLKLTKLNVMAANGAYKLANLER
jgi:hypothetical protein